MPTASTFTVLVVCTANICRSPLAAGLLRARLGDRFGEQAERVEVASAGVHALVGQGMDPPAADLLGQASAHRVTGEGFRARQLDQRLVAAADLVLTMTREHRRAVVTLVPAAQRRTFTLPELARVARALTDSERSSASGADVVEAWRWLIASAPALRGPTAPADPDEDDVADPYRRPKKEYRRAGRRISDAVDAVVGVLAHTG